MAKEIKQKIVLDGEAEYKKALKESRTELSRLKGEMKAEAAEAERNATASEKAAKKQEALKKQIAEQEKIVKTLSKALEEAKSKYSDNAEVIAKWENQYNAARTTLAGMKNELDDVTSGFKSMKSDVDMGVVATKSFADALGEIGSVGENISGAIEDVFMGVVSTIREAVEELWTMVVDTAGKANGWADEAEFWGTDAATIQQWEHAVESAHNKFTSLTDVATRLTLGGKDKEVAEYLGLSNENYENEWDFALAAMDELKRLENEDTKKYQLAMSEIFGQRKAKNVMDLVNDWDQIKGLLPQFDAENGGVGLDNEGISFMSDFAVKLDTITQTAEALKDMFAGTFATMTLGMVVEAQGALDAIGKYMTSDDPQAKQEALDELREHVENFFKEAAKVIEECIGILYDVGKDLQESDDPLVQLIGKIMTDIASALDWMIDNQDKVKEAFEAIFGIWLIAKLGAVAGKLTSIIAQIEVIKAFKAPNLGVGGVGTGTGTGVGGLGLSGFLGNALKVAPWAAIASLPLIMVGSIIADNLEAKRYKEELKEDYEADAALFEDVDAPAKEYWESLSKAQFGEGEEDQGELWANIIKGLQDRFGWQEETAEGAVWHKGGQANEWFDTMWGYLSDDMRTKLEDYYNNTFLENGAQAHPYDVVELEHALRDEMRAALEEDLMTGGQSIFTDAERTAAETFWDLLRDEDHELTDEEYEAFENAFTGNEELFGKIDEMIDQLMQQDDSNDWRNMENLPSDWWVDADKWGGITGADLRGFQGLPAQMTAAVAAGAAAGVSGIKVMLDGQAVGAAMASYMGVAMARDIIV